MHEFKITQNSTGKDSTGKDLEAFALSLHSIIKLPLTIRSLNNKCIRIEEGKVIDTDYTGPINEQSLKENRIIRTIATNGAYKGTYGLFL